LTLLTLSSALYRPDTTICYTKEDLSIKEWIDFEAELNPDAKFKTIQRDRIGDCLLAVYVEEATCTFYDTPIILDQLSTNFYSKGLCGNPGGFCSDPALTSEESCMCPEKQAVLEGLTEDLVSDAVCATSTDNKWTAQYGNLITVGEVFEPFGYGLGFRRELGKHELADSLPNWHVPFSQVISLLRSLGTIPSIVDEHIPDVFSLSCSQAVEVDDSTVMQVVNMLGLFIITLLIALVGVLLGFLESIVRCFVRLCPLSCGSAGKQYLSAVADAEAAFEIELEDGATDSPREFYYEETDCDDPHAGELHRLNLAHFQTEVSAKRLRDVERVCLHEPALALSLFPSSLNLSHKHEAADK